MASKKGKPVPLEAPKKGSKKEPPPPSPRTLAALEEKAAQERAERDSAAQEFIMALLDQVDAIEEEKEVERMLIPYAVDRVMDETIKALELLTVPRPEDWQRGGTGNWAEDEEPEVPAIDAWARGAIPIKRRPQPQVTEPRTPSANFPSTLSRTSKGNTRASRSPSRRASITASERGGRAESVMSSSSRMNASAMKRLVEISSRAALPALPVVPPQLPKLMLDVQERKRELASHDADEEQRLREEIAIRQAREQLRKERTDRDAADLAKLADVQKSLRNQNYSYNHSGELVVLTNVDVERLPAATVGPKVAVADGESADAKNFSRNRTSSRNLVRQPTSKPAAATSAQRELTKAPTSKSLQNGESKLARSTSLSEPAAKRNTSGKFGLVDYIPAAQSGTGGVLVDSIKLAAGVTLKVGASVRSGGIPHHEPGHVTRKEYLATREERPISDRRRDPKSDRRATGLVLPLIEKPKSR